MNAFREGQQVLDQCACIHLTISAEHARGVTCKKPENSCESVLSSGLGGNYTASAFNAVRFRMINFGPSNRISCFCLSLVKSRVTVSRDAPILSAISSWVMLKEIYEQPRAVRDTTLGRVSQDTGHIFLDQMEISEAEFRAATKINIIACGTSWHAGQAGKFMIESLARVPVEVDYASEWRYRNPIVDPNTITIVISQSGETADTIAAQREAKSKGSKTLAICNVVGSMITREAAGTIYTHGSITIARIDRRVAERTLCTRPVVATVAAVDSNHAGVFPGVLRLENVTAEGMDRGNCFCRHLRRSTRTHRPICKGGTSCHGHNERRGECRLPCPHRRGDDV